MNGYLRSGGSKGRAVETIVIQKTGGTAGAIAAGSAWLDVTLRILARSPIVPMRPSELVVERCAVVRTVRAANPALGPRLPLRHLRARQRRGRPHDRKRNRSAPITPVLKSEALRHQEFVLTYKTSEPAGPVCLPIVA